MKRIILTSILLLLITVVNSQSYKSQQYYETFNETINCKQGTCIYLQDTKRIDNFNEFFGIDLGEHVSTYQSKLIGENLYQLKSVNNVPVEEGIMLIVKTNSSGYINTIITQVPALANDFEAYTNGFIISFGYPEYIGDKKIWMGNLIALTTYYDYSTETGTVMLGYK